MKKKLEKFWPQWRNSELFKSESQSYFCLSGLSCMLMQQVMKSVFIRLEFFICVFVSCHDLQQWNLFELLSPLLSLESSQGVPPPEVPTVQISSTKCWQGFLSVVVRSPPTVPILSVFSSFHYYFAWRCCWRFCSVCLTPSSGLSAQALKVFLPLWVTYFHNIDLCVYVCTCLNKI